MCIFMKYLQDVKTYSNYCIINQLYYNKFVVHSTTIFVNIKLAIVIAILATSLT